MSPGSVGSLLEYHLLCKRALRYTGGHFFGAVESTRNLSKVQDVSAKFHGNTWKLEICAICPCQAGCSIHPTLTYPSQIQSNPSTFANKSNRAGKSKSKMMRTFLCFWWCFSSLVLVHLPNIGQLAINSGICIGNIYIIIHICYITYTCILQIQLYLHTTLQKNPDKHLVVF